MARKSKSVYERIEDKNLEIERAEEALRELKEELKMLHVERENQEMNLLYEQMKASGLDFNKTIELLSKPKK